MGRWESVTTRRGVLRAGGMAALALAGGTRAIRAWAQPRPGGTLPMAAFAEPDSWDPHKASLIMYTSQLYSQLVEWDPVNPDRIVGDLAESWQVSDNGTVYTFKLHEHAKWSDGRPVTAEDVVFSLTRMKESGKPRATAWAVYAEGWEATGPATVRIKLKAPAAAFLPFLAVDYVKIMPKHVVGAGVDIERPENIVGSGPFKVSKWTKGDSYEAVRNPLYFKKGYPVLDGIRQFLIRDKSTLIAAYKAERILMQNSSFSGLSVQDHLALKEDLKGKFTVHVLGFPGSNAGIFLNVKRKPLDDPRVRKALHLATDRQAMIKLFAADDVAVLGTPFPPDTWYGQPSKEAAKLPGYRQPKDADIAEAKRLLAEAGVPNGFKTSILARRVFVYPDLATVWKQQMARIGVDVEINAMESAAGLSAYSEGNFDSGVIISAVLIDEPEAVIADAFRVGAVRNYAGWSNGEVERLVGLQRAELNRARRSQILRQLEDELLSWKNNHWIGLYWAAEQWVLHDRVRGFVPPRSGATTLKNEHYWLAQG